MSNHGGGTQWAVDSLVLREGTVFTHGWCAHPKWTIDSLEIALFYVDGQQETVNLQYGLTREDVSAAWPGLVSACGFSAYTSLKHAKAVKQVRLEVHFAGGKAQSILLPLPVQPSGNSANGPDIAPFPWKKLTADFLRVPRMLLRGQWSVLWRGLTNRIAWWRVRSVTESASRKAFAEINQNAVLIVDHALGGGANQFRSDLVNRHVESGRDVIVWTFVPYLLRYEISIHHAHGARVRKMYLEWDAWRWLLEGGKVSLVEFNNCVGFPRQEQVPLMLTAFRNAGVARLRLYLHDFHMVCPSHFLMNDEGRFCGVPDVARCRTCLPNINDGLAELFGARDIDLWRRNWAEMLAVADEIVYFSRSSREILARAYPNIRADQWLFRPHQIASARGKFQYPSTQPGLRVAVVGHISRPKGSEEIMALVRLAVVNDVPLEVVIIGTLLGISEDGDLPLMQTGPYAHKDLCKILNAQRVHLVLMPSICSETFSYVTHELMQLEAPILCFNLGAQAEAVASYSLGRVVALGSASGVLANIQAFKADLDSRALR